MTGTTIGSARKQLQLRKPPLRVAAVLQTLGRSSWSNRLGPQRCQHRNRCRYWLGGPTRPDFRRVQTKTFIGAMTTWDRLEVELERARARLQGRRRLAAEPSEQEAPGRSRKGRKGTKLCPPLYYPRHPDFPPQPQAGESGGAMSLGDPAL